jgi:polar amino acid transport system permease protein
VLIGSGMIVERLFRVLALASRVFPGHRGGAGQGLEPADPQASEWFIFVFRGSPLFIQFFFAYFLFLSLKSVRRSSTRSPPPGWAR